MSSTARTKFDIVPWNTSFNTDIAIIDEQHRQLVSLINDLAHEYVYGSKPGEMERILDSLIDYAAYHFETEEGLWAEALAHDDDFLGGHLNTHKGFVDKVLAIRARIEIDDSRKLIDELLSFLTSWLAHHILYEDKRFSLVFLQVKKGVDLDTAKTKAEEAMSGRSSGLIQSVLTMYKELSSRTLALEHEAFSRERAEKALLDQETYWRSVLEAGADNLWDWDLESLDISHDSDHKLAGRFFQNGYTIHPDDWHCLNQDIINHILGKTELFEHVYRIINPEGSERWIQSIGKIIERNSLGHAKRMVGTQTDITERKTTELDLKRLAFEDTLTGLPNRRSLEDSLANEISYCENHGKRLIFALIDLDNFREINEAYGPVIGDALLQALAQRLLSMHPVNDTVARIGGDEFVVLLNRLAFDDADFQRLNRLINIINKPFVIDGLTLSITASIGVTEFPQPIPSSANQLLRQAQQALFQAKLTGKGIFKKYDISLEQDTREHIVYLKEINDALINNEFVLYYQPKVNMKTGIVLGVEALIRWQKPTGELISPSEFLPAIANHSLEVELGDWVIETALKQMNTWLQQGISVHVSVNVSSRQLFDDSFIDKLSSALVSYPDLSASLLQLEVLESSMLNDLDSVSKVMQQSRDLGVTFALDDFGTGYSSLSYLKHLPASVLKIDQSFIHEMTNNTNDLSIISGVIGMANAFGMDVIAEGVENTVQGDLLLRLGCLQGQGYGIARPMPADKFSDWVKHWQAEPSWIGQEAVEPNNLHILYAEVEHRFWIKKLEDWLYDRTESIPLLNHNLCKVGKWISDSSHSHLKQIPAFDNVISSHYELHTLAKTAIEKHAKGNKDEALNMLPLLKQQRDLFLKHLDSLI
jgi:diguanylate cyclase (GGDEF)-like protein/hemerythrin-like metal-binding protein/PAS domain S-box-containing protein